jgi:hypothetical protein
LSSLYLLLATLQMCQVLLNFTIIREVKLMTSAQSKVQKMEQPL